MPDCKLVSTVTTTTFKRRTSNDKTGARYTIAKGALIACNLALTTGCSDLPREASVQQLHYVMGTRIAVPAGATPLLHSDCEAMAQHVTWTQRAIVEDLEIQPPLVVDEVQAVQSSGLNDDEPPTLSPAFCRYLTSVESGFAIEITAHVALPGAEPWSNTCSGITVGQINESTFVSGWAGFTYQVDSCIASHSSHFNFADHPSLPGAGI